MALEVWYKSDIQNALRAAELANAAALNAADREGDPYVTGYQAGYRSALTTLALAFGLPVAPLVHGPKPRVLEHCTGLPSTEPQDQGDRGLRPDGGLEEIGAALSTPTRPRGDHWLADGI